MGIRALCSNAPTIFVSVNPLIMAFITSKNTSESVTWEKYAFQYFKLSVSRYLADQCLPKIGEFDISPCLVLDELLYLLIVGIFFIALTQTLQVFVNLSNLINISSLNILALLINITWSHGCRVQPELLGLGGMH